MRSVKYLEQLREKLENKSDAELARKLNLSKASISHYITGRRVMDEETCLAVAIALDLNPMEVMMAAGIDRAEKAGQQSLWTVFSQRMAATAASALLAVGVTLFLTPENAEAALVKAEFNANGQHSLYYVKSQSKLKMSISWRVNMRPSSVEAKVPRLCR
ncbi:helix-turn-helix transcriptional regulator [Massilia sp. NR 4-1]|uniref:helix-turn-helix domain-containing protein n=1 Tax=Massilia sp. NR 4-1 TaxID=1678028 RepID=UPI0009E602CC|nr:helix-turn-helix transcriptional regulator [Massilia sp. NR 4-1]